MFADVLLNAQHVVVVVVSITFKKGVMLGGGGEAVVCSCLFQLNHSWMSVGCKYFIRGRAASQHMLTLWPP